jgi:hypothetical protein
VTDGPLHVAVRLWVSHHENGWETWIAQTPHGTFAAWTCQAGHDASGLYVEDSFEHASSAARFQLARMTGHSACGPTCGEWHQREPPEGATFS